MSPVDSLPQGGLRFCSIVTGRKGPRHGCLSRGPTPETPPRRPHPLPEMHLLTLTPWALRSQHVNFRGTQAPCVPWASATRACSLSDSSYCCYEARPRTFLPPSLPHCPRSRLGDTLTVQRLPGASPGCVEGAPVPRASAAHLPVSWEGAPGELAKAAPRAGARACFWRAILPATLARTSPPPPQHAPCFTSCLNLTPSENSGRSETRGSQPCLLCDLDSGGRLSWAPQLKWELTVMPLRP